MLEVLEHALSYGQTKQADRLSGQSLDLRRPGRRRRSAESGAASARSPPTSSRRTSCCGWRRRRSASTSRSIRWTRFATSCGARPTRRVADLERRRDGEIVTVGGIVSSREAADDEEGRPDGLPARSTISPARPRWSSSTACYAASRELCHADTVLVVKGRVDHKQEGETKLIALEVTAFEAAPERTEVRLKVDARAARAGIVRELGPRREGLPGRRPRRGRARDLRRPADARARPGLPRAARGRTSSPR